MSKSLAQIQKEIDSLQREAERIRQKEIAGVVGRIKEAIATYGLSASDLGFKSGNGTKRPSEAATKAKAAVSRKPRFSDEAGNTWGGRGPRPAWFKAALAAGKKPEELAV
jgi:DNA-binding protein H-NS